MGGRSSVEVVILQGLAALAEGGVLPLVRAQQGLVRVPGPASCSQTQVLLECFGMFYDGGVGGGPGGPEGGVVPPAAEGHGGGLAGLAVPGGRVSRGGRRTTH